MNLQTASTNFWAQFSEAELRNFFARKEEITPNQLVNITRHHIEAMLTQKGKRKNA